MRTLGFRTHVLLVLSGAIGVLAGLGRPWYAPAPSAHEDAIEVIGKIEGPLESLLGGVQRWVTAAGGQTGWDALGEWATALAAFSLVAAVCALASLSPALQAIVREPLRYCSLAAFGIAVWRLVDSPGPNDALELRSGAFVATICALMLCVTAQGVANAPRRRRVAPPTYTAPPAPPAYEGSAGPPG